MPFPQDPLAVRVDLMVPSTDPPVLVATNLAKNPSVEVDVTNLVNITATGVAGAVRSTLQAYAGTGSAMREVTSTPSGDPGVTFSIDARSSGALSWGVWVYFTVAASARAYAQGTVTSTGATGAIFGTVVSVPANTWTRLTHSVSSLSALDRTITSAGYTVTATGAPVGTRYFVDAATIVADTTLPTYFAGDTVEPFHTYAWTGTAHASASTKKTAENVRSAQDITADVLVRDGININRGRADEASSIDPSSCALTIENRDGRYSSRNPASPYYGILGRNTPMRVGIGSPPVAAAAQSTVDSTSLVAPSIVAEATGMLFCTWVAAPVGNITATGFALGAERDGTFTTWAAGTKNIAAGATGTSTATHSVTATDQAGISVAVPGASIVAGGFSGITTSRADVTFAVSGVAAGDYLLAVHGWSSDPDGRMTIAPAIDGIETPDWVALADSGASSGPRLRAWICRVPAGAAATQNFRFARFDSLGMGTIPGGGDNYGRVWRITGATDYYPRHVGEVSEWPQRWDLSGVDVHSPVTSAGVLRRLGQGSSPLRSSINRHIVNSADVVAYWPMEEPEGSTSFASPISGVEPATFRGTPLLAADDGFLGSEPIPTWQGAGFVGEVPSYTSAGELFAGALFAIPAAGMAASGANLLSVALTGGTISRAIIEYGTGTGSLILKLSDGSGVTVLSQPVAFAFDGDRFFSWFTLRQSGADVVWQLEGIQIDPGEYGPSASELSGTLAGHTLGRARAVTAGIEGSNATSGALSLTAAVTIGHITIASRENAVFRSDALHRYPALAGYISEGAAERIARLCREEGVDVLGLYDLPDYRGPYAAAGGTALGAQRAGTLVELLQEAADADGGILYEPRGFIGLAYRPRVARENQAAKLTLSYTAGDVAEPFEPVEDDQSTRNDITVTRIDGASARAELTVGPLSTKAPPNGVGRYDESVDLSLWLDSQAAEEAGWRLHLGTWDEARYPQVSTKLHKSTPLIPTAAGLDVGEQIEITGLPSWLPPGPVDLSMQGYSETLEPYAWGMTFNATPAGPFRIAELDSTDFGRLDSDDSTLSSDVTTTATSLSVAVASGSPLWTTDAAEFPLDAIVGGEVVRVTAIAGASSPQTWTVTRSINGIVKSHSTGAKISLAEPVYVGK